MKRIVSLLLCVVLLMALSVTAFAQTNARVYYAKENVFLREKANANSNILGQLDAGEPFNVERTGNPWYYGYAGEGTNIYDYYGEIMHGYVNGNYLSTTKP